MKLLKNRKLDSIDKAQRLIQKNEYNAATTSSIKNSAANILASYSDLILLT